jgi:prophage antirepressor-like protein
MNELQVINEQEVLGKQFKMYGTKEEPLFLAKDVANWIEHSNVSKMLNSVDDDEKLIATCDVTNSYTTSKSRNNQDMWFLTEDGLYEVLMQSRKPIAKQFKKEVKKILKQIRQTGGYIPYSQEESDEEILAKALIIAQNTLAKKDELIEQMKPKVNTFNRFMNAEGLYTSTQMAKLFKMSSAMKLNKLLNAEGLIYKQGNTWMPYATTNKEWFKVIVREREGHAFTQLKFTPIGVIEIAKILNVELNEDDLVDQNK